MKRIVSFSTALVVILLIGVGIVSADPGPNNPYRDKVVNVDCEGDDHDFDLLFTVGLAPWFDPAGTTTALPQRVERQNEDGSWQLMGQIPGRGIPSIFCTWERDDANFRGDVQFAPAH